MIQYLSKRNCLKQTEFYIGSILSWGEPEVVGRALHRGLRRGAPKGPTGLEAATPARAGVAGSAVGADAIAAFVDADRIHGAGVCGPAHEGARGEQGGDGAKDESLHGSLLLCRLNVSPISEQLHISTS
jgi:hypothetical protein